MISNVVFDLGGVVLGRDFELDGGRIDTFSFVRGDRPFPDFWKDFDKGIISQTKVAEAIAELEGYTVEHADSLITALGKMFNEFPQTVGLIKELSSAGYKIYAMSNMPYEFWMWMKELAIFEYFDGVLISSIEKLSKPDPAFFNLLAERFGLKPEETLFVDDKPTNTAPAETLGFNVCVYDTVAGPDNVRRILCEKGCYKWKR